VITNLISVVLRGIRRRTTYSYNYYVRCRADKKEYIRYLGALIGKGCSIYTDPRNFFSEPWLIEIGNNVTVGQGVLLITHDGASRLFRDDMPGMNRYGNRFGTIVIRDNCFIGYNAILLPGVEIGPDSIVGAGSVVTKSVPPRTVVVGNPARPIKTLDEYIDSYVERMISLEATDRVSLRKELTTKLWGHER
jgi:acetyltransferase-like isoleucine patch superfamily enzyme